MSSLRLTMLALLAACTPPDVELGDDTGGGAAVSTDPSIRIIHPVQDDCFTLDASGNLALFVAVDVENHEVVPPGELVDGQGHWHVQLTPHDASYDAVPAQFYELEREGVAPGNVSISATLVDSGHIEIGGPGTVAIVEFELRDAATPCP